MRRDEASAPGTNTLARRGENGTGDVRLGAVPNVDQLAIWDAVLGYLIERPEAAPRESLTTLRVVREGS